MRETATTMRNIRTTSQNSVSVTRSRYSKGVSGSSILLIVAFLALLPAPALAQTYTLSPSPFLTILDNSGRIVNGGCAWTYVAGTSTPATTYSDSAGTPNANPIKADSAGRFSLYLLPGSSYKIIYENIPCSAASHGTTLRTADNIGAVPSSGLNIDVTGTAGESLSTGDVVYLSDGSGSLNAGQWYRADADLIYGSIGAGEIGMVPTAITSGASGSIRIQGRVTGLSGLTIGAPQYVSATTAILTATAPTNARLVGVADSTTSVVLTPNPPASLSAVKPGTCDCRLTLTTATPVTVADVTAATTVRFTPYKGNRLSLYDGNRWREYAFSELSFTVPSTTNTMYDLFVYDNAGTLTVEGTAWTNDTTRATAIALQDGVYVKSGATTRLYVGSFRTTGVSGQTEDSFVKRYVWNNYNRVRRPMSRADTTASWTYSTATYRQANAATANQLDFVVGVSEDMVEARVMALAHQSNLGVEVGVAIGLDSTTTATGFPSYQTSDVANHRFPLHASYVGFPGIGRHTLVWLEISAAVATTTFVGAGSFNQQSGIFGSVMG